MPWGYETYQKRSPRGLCQACTPQSTGSHGEGFLLLEEVSWSSGLPRVLHGCPELLGRLHFPYIS